VNPPTCYHSGACATCACVQRAMRGEKDPCVHGGLCVDGCVHVAEAEATPEVREIINARECAEVCAF
jgi:hypothetical protein